MAAAARSESSATCNALRTEMSHTAPIGAPPSRTVAGWHGSLDRRRSSGPDSCCSPPSRSPRSRRFGRTSTAVPLAARWRMRSPARLEADVTSTVSGCTARRRRRLRRRPSRRPASLSPAHAWACPRRRCPATGLQVRFVPCAGSEMSRRRPGSCASATGGSSTSDRIHGCRRSQCRSTRRSTSRTSA
jgi:hypothetical protein